MPSRMTKEPMKRKVVRKSCAKDTETAPRGMYKTPCVSNGVRETLLGSASEHTLTYMLNYNPAQTEITRQGMIRDLQRIRDAYKHPPHITARS